MIVIVLPIEPRVKTPKTCIPPAPRGVYRNARTTALKEDIPPRWALAIREINS